LPPFFPPCHDATEDNWCSVAFSAVHVNNSLITSMYALLRNVGLYTPYTLQGIMTIHTLFHVCSVTFRVLGVAAVYESIFVVSASEKVKKCKWCV